METIPVSIIVNTGKLGSINWPIFKGKIENAIETFQGVLQFSGSSETPKENFCWVFLLEDNYHVFDKFQRQIRELQIEYQHDSIMWIERRRAHSPT